MPGALDSKGLPPLALDGRPPMDDADMVVLRGTGAVDFGALARSRALPGPGEYPRTRDAEVRATLECGIPAEEEVAPGAARSEAANPPSPVMEMELPNNPDEASVRLKLPCASELSAPADTAPVALPGRVVADNAAAVGFTGPPAPDNPLVIIICGFTAVFLGREAANMLWGVVAGGIWPPDIVVANPAGTRVGCGAFENTMPPDVIVLP
jgi:hypothetical protein